MAKETENKMVIRAASNYLGPQMWAKENKSKMVISATLIPLGHCRCGPKGTKVKGSFQQSHILLDYKCGLKEMRVKWSF